MDRKQQLGNVAFGGAWSEQIAGDEALALAVKRLEAAIDQSRYEDLRGWDDVNQALAMVTGAHPKGAMLATAWRRALLIQSAELRASELWRICTALRAGLGERLAGW